MTAYREVDAPGLTAFAKHISIAETLYGVNLDLLHHPERLTDDELQRSFLQTWGDLWEQLDQARAIVFRLKRDTAAFDAARGRGGDPYLVAAGIIPITQKMREATVMAIAALRACVPEVIVPASRPTAPGGVVDSGSVTKSSLTWARVVFFFMTILVGTLARCALYMD